MLEIFCLVYYLLTGCGVNSERGRDKTPCQTNAASCCILLVFCSSELFRMLSQSKSLLGRHSLFLNLESVTGFRLEAFMRTCEEIPIDTLIGLLCDIAWTAQ